MKSSIFNYNELMWYAVAAKPLLLCSDVFSYDHYAPLWCSNYVDAQILKKKKAAITKVELGEKLTKNNYYYRDF